MYHMYMYVYVYMYMLVLLAHVAALGIDMCRLFVTSVRLLSLTMSMSIWDLNLPRLQVTSCTCKQYSIVKQVVRIRMLRIVTSQ